ncbi:hypothetical protein BDW59DRAFT_50319 [Aspergillus cavernicola]|uniref:Uncharacterized protein n=1 Tax=Aspergillus cavernicola TaxID=176166 RepID=A0ABR4ILA9_9EURO
MAKWKNRETDSMPITLIHDDSPSAAMPDTSSKAIKVMSTPERGLRSPSPASSPNPQTPSESSLQEEVLSDPPVTNGMKRKLDTSGALSNRSTAAEDDAKEETTIDPSSRKSASMMFTTSIHCRCAIGTKRQAYHGRTFGKG